MSIDQAVNRVVAYLRQRESVTSTGRPGGLDPNDIHIINGYPLKFQDLWALVEAAVVSRPPAEPWLPPMVGDVVHAVVPQGHPQFDAKDAGRCLPGVVQVAHPDRAVERVNLAVINRQEITWLPGAFLDRSQVPKLGTWHPKTECPYR